MTISEMIEVYHEQCGGIYGPTELRCGIDRYNFIAKAVIGFTSKTTFFGAKIIWDENLLNTEFNFWPLRYQIECLVHPVPDGE
jgi:hypothetical protein